MHFDATPAVEKAYRWAQSLARREFVGTESRLHTLIGLLRQIVHGSETDPEARIAELERRRAEIDDEIAAALEESIKNGVRDNHALQQTVRRTIGRWVGTSLRRRPMIVPVVIES